MHQQLLDDAPERSRLGVGHRQHDDAHDLGALGPAAAALLMPLQVADEYEDEARPVAHLGDAILPPRQELLVGQGREKGGDGAVVSDARGVDGGEVGGQVRVLPGVEGEDDAWARHFVNTG